MLYFVSVHPHPHGGAARVHLHVQDTIEKEEIWGLSNVTYACSPLSLIMESVQITADYCNTIGLALSA